MKLKMPVIQAEQKQNTMDTLISPGTQCQILYFPAGHPSFAHANPDKPYYDVTFAFPHKHVS